MPTKTTEDIVNEVLDAFIDQGNNPSSDVLDMLARQLGVTPTIMKSHYSARYNERTGEGDPYGPLPGERA